MSNFVFGDNFFFLGDNIFLAPLVDILQLFAKWAEVEKKSVFFWLITFFFAEGDKKKYSTKKKPTFFPLPLPSQKRCKILNQGGPHKILLTQDKKIIHQQTKLLIQRKHHYTFDMMFLCPPSSYYFLGNQQKFSISPLMLYGI